MDVFKEHELKLITKLKEEPAQTILKISESCPLHSVCMPLPLFRVYKIDDATFEAEWNEFHRRGPKQTFQFADVMPAIARDIPSSYGS